MRKRIYIFGPPEGTFAVCERLYILGFAPYNPWNDVIAVKKLKRYNELVNVSKEWLAVSEAVFLAPGFEKAGEGTLSGIAFAKELGIPIFTHIDNLLRWQREKEELVR